MSAETEEHRTMKHFLFQGSIMTHTSSSKGWQVLSKLRVLERLFSRQNVTSTGFDEFWNGQVLRYDCILMLKNLFVIWNSNLARCPVSYLIIPCRINAQLHKILPPADNAIILWSQLLWTVKYMLNIVKSRNTHQLPHFFYCKTNY